MTEPQQKEVDELLEQLQQEEECCEGCPDRFIAEVCEGCGTHGNIRDLEIMIADLTGQIEEE